jgi:hypothetical protein
LQFFPVISVAFGPVAISRILARSAIGMIANTSPLEMPPCTATTFSSSTSLCMFCWVVCGLGSSSHTIWIGRSSTCPLKSSTATCAPL